MIHKNSIENQVKRKKIIGSGARRVVYDFGKGYVLKVAKSKYGIKSNKREVITYNSSPSSIRNHLAEIIDHGNKYQWLIMKKHTRKFPRTLEYKRKLIELRIMFRSNGIIPYEVLSRQGNPNYNNLRIKKDGQIVVIDYGNFRNKKKRTI